MLHQQYAILVKRFCVMQWNPSKADTTGTTAACQEYGDTHISVLPMHYFHTFLSTRLYGKHLGTCTFILRILKSTI